MGDGPVHVILVVEAEAAQEERPHVLLVHGQDGGGRLCSVHIPAHRTGLRSSVRDPDVFGPPGSGSIS